VSTKGTPLLADRGVSHQNEVQILLNPYWLNPSGHVEQKKAKNVTLVLEKGES
jgi:hypothetical protein